MCVFRECDTSLKIINSLVIFYWYVNMTKIIYTGDCDMYQEKPLVIYSKNHDGRHWLTTLEFPPLQIAPVAANHCRVAYFLATLISSKLIKYENNIPMTLSLTRNDVAASRVLAESFPEQIDYNSISDELMIRLVFEGAASQHENDIGRTQELFLTPRPMPDWQGTYD